MNNRLVIVPALTMFILGYALVVLGVKQLDIEWDRRLLAILLLIPVGAVLAVIALWRLVNAFIDQ
jgi:multisubunit Na+/H+ antiporter MnhB subunit